MEAENAPKSESGKALIDLATTFADKTIKPKESLKLVELQEDGSRLLMFQTIHSQTGRKNYAK